MTSYRTGNPFDPDEWEAQWRAILPQLRKRVATYPLESPEDVDEIVNEAGARLFAAQTFRRKRDAFLRIAEATARRVALDRARTAKRHSSGPQARKAQLAAIPDEWLADPDAIGRHRVELRLAVEQVKRHPLWGKRKAGVQEALDLIDRGGPYDQRERKVISRARAPLTELFKDFLGGFVPIRVFRPRARVRPPVSDVSPLTTIIAGAVAAVVVGVFPPSGAGVEAGSPRQKAAVLRAPSHAPIESAKARPAAEPGARPAATNSTRQLAVRGEGADHGEAWSPSVSAKLPAPDRPGELRIEVPRPASDGGTIVGARLSCNTDLRRMVCGHAATVARASAG